MIQDTLLHIKYPTGEMNIIIDKFFPTTVARAVKVFQLVKEHEPLDGTALYYHLEKLAKGYKDQIEHLSDVMDSTVSTEDYKTAYEEHRRCMRSYEQAKRNMRDLKKIMRLEV